MSIYNIRRHFLDEYTYTRLYEDELIEFRLILCVKLSYELILFYIMLTSKRQMALNDILTAFQEGKSNIFGFSEIWNWGVFRIEALRTRLILFPI